MIYNWQQADRAACRYGVSQVEDMLSGFAELSGHASEILEVFEAVRLEAVIDMVVAETIKTSEIEGEYLSPQDVVSSVGNNPGLYQTPVAAKDKITLP